MTRKLVLALLTVILFSASLGKKDKKDEDTETWSAKNSSEGHCLKEWPHQDDVVDIDWFEKYMLQGFRVPMASEMYYHKYATKLSLPKLHGTSDLNDMCLRVTNNPNAVFAGLTDTPLPTNWQSFSSDPNSGGIFFQLANQMSHFYFKKFFLVHQGFGGSVVETCASKKDKVYVKECSKNKKAPGAPAASEEDDKKKHKKRQRDDNKWMITKTDNKNYAVVVNCFAKINRKAWHVLSVNETLKKSVKTAIIDHIAELGYDKTKVVEVTYNEKTCAQMGQPVA